MIASDIKPGAVYEEKFPGISVWLVLEVVCYEDDSVVIREVTLMGWKEGIVSSVTIPFYLLDGYTLVEAGT